MCVVWPLALEPGNVYFVETHREGSLYQEYVPVGKTSQIIYLFPRIQRLSHMAGQTLEIICNLIQPKR